MGGMLVIERRQLGPWYANVQGRAILSGFPSVEAFGNVPPPVGGALAVLREEGIQWIQCCVRRS